MGFSGVTAHNHHDVCVFDINPVVGHRTATKCWSKTCYRWSVSDARPVINRQHAEGAHKFCVSMPVSLLAAEAHSIPVEVQRFTVMPCSFFSIKLASRSAFISFAIREKASSRRYAAICQTPAHDIPGSADGFHCGRSPAAPPFRAAPRGSPDGPGPLQYDKSLLWRSSRHHPLYINSPQPTEQYVQVLRISFARSSL